MDETALRVRRIIDTAADTHRDFAVRIGLEPTKLSKSLRGRRRFTPGELSIIAEAGGVSVDWLLHGPGTELDLEAGDGHATVPGGGHGGHVGHGGQQTGPPGPVTDPQRTGDERRTEFLEAAWKLISEQGYHAVRIADIAQACGTSSGAVHYYFPTKQDVLNAALLHCVQNAFERQSIELRTVESARDRLLKLIDMQLPTPGRVHHEWLVWLQFWTETALRPELRSLHNDFYARWRETVVRIVRRGQRQQQFRADADPEQLALGLTALTDGLAIQVLTGAPGITTDRMRNALLDYIDHQLIEHERNTQ